MGVLNVTVKGVGFSNPIIIASGPGGFGEEFFKYINPSEIGGFTAKTVTPKPKPGNRSPRIAYVRDGLMNSIGLQNPGVERFVAEFARSIPEETVRITSIGGETPEDFAMMAKAVDGFSEMVEVNLSCPNVNSGEVVAADPKLSSEIISACRVSTAKPLIAKLSPDVDVVSQAKTVTEAGADIVNVANSIQGARFNVNTGKPFLKNVRGGLSGPAFMPVILWKVYRVREAFPDLPIIGLGGVTRAEDAIEYAIAGASLVGIGTEAMINPSGIRKITEDLGRYLEDKNLRFEEIIGAAHRGGLM